MNRPQSLEYCQHVGLSGAKEKLLDGGDKAINEAIAIINIALKAYSEKYPSADTAYFQKPDKLPNWLDTSPVTECEARWSTDGC